MADGKKSFILYADLIHVVKKLVLKDRENKTNWAGELFLHILEYVNDNDPVPIDFIVEMTFEPIKLSLKRDLQKYAITATGKSNAGKLGNLKRWNKDVYDKVVNSEITLEDGVKIAESRRVSHSDKSIANVAVNDSDNVNVSVNDNDINKRENNSDKNALTFLKSTDFNFEIFEMQNKKNVKDWEKMLELYSYKVDEEGLEYTKKILEARLRRWMSSWITNENKNKEKSSAKKESINSVTIN